MRLDAIRATDAIQANYLHYLSTAFPLRDERLARQYREQLGQRDRLLKGPYLEATPPYASGATIREMVEAGVLARGMPALEALQLDRPLYRHQESAIRKAVQGKRNLVVATGTGSGKTESFLIPVLDHLIREKENGTLGPGVRALLLYPMNALANDQLKRLRKLLENYPDITFGRFTGETKTKPAEAREHFHNNFPGEPDLDNELKSRTELRSTPPHILLTNYAMLEYLLLRPEDCEFFDGVHAGHWRFLVLDEVHIYNGAIGIEMAMLLRRLKDRIVRSEPGRLQCMATSATLGRGHEDFPRIASFAEKLFGEPFEWMEGDDSRQDVVDASRIPVASLGETWGRPDPALYLALAKALEESPDGFPEQAGRLALEHGVPEPVVRRAGSDLDGHGTQNRAAAFLYGLLEGDACLRRLRSTLDDGPASLENVAGSLFGPGGSDALRALVDLAVRARKDDDSQPLLPARYHLFVRALEGAYFSLTPEPELFLDRVDVVQRQDDEFRAYEIASCRRCGELYLAGKVDGNKILPPGPPSEDNRNVQFFRVLADDASGDPIEDDEDEQVASVDHVGREPVSGVMTLCFRCGAVEPGVLPPCECKKEPAVRRRVQRMNTPAGRVNYCPACGRRGPGLVSRFLTGQDAPASVISTALYEQIPARVVEQKPRSGEAARSTSGDDGSDEGWENRSRSSVKPAEERETGSRKLLIFSDSRQNAAFFACFLGRTYEQILRRRLIVLALERNADAIREKRWRVQDLVNPLLAIGREHDVFEPRMSPQQKEDEVWRWLLLEMRAPDRRNCLEGLGFISFAPVRPEDWSAPPPLFRAPWSLTEAECWDLYRVLLDSFRHQGAITYPDGVSPREPVFAPRNFEFRFRGADADAKKKVYAWSSPARGKFNRRLDFLEKLARRGGLDAPDRKHLNEVLDKIWSLTLVSERGAFRDHLERASLREVGQVYRYRHTSFEIDGLDPESWHRCRKCGMLSSVNLRGVCPSYRCEGTVEPCDPREVFGENHYARLYAGLEALPMKVEEHTAQLTGEAAATLQDRFVRNEINVLSCSTTFELGVDVGELEAVLLRNVPPTTANYVQRAGRAGRRTDSTAFVLTYCQRRSHDLTYYQEPERMIAGVVEAPHFELQNEKIVRRHAHSVALAWFFRQNPALFGKVESFYQTGTGATDGVKAFREDLESRPADLEACLGRILPRTLIDSEDGIQVSSWKWIEKIVGEGGVLTISDQKLKTDLERLEQARKERFEAGKPVDRIQRTKKTLEQQYLIGFLANAGVLPKYGFPVDVVSLEILHHGEEAKQLELQRDLRIAISEYAPGSEIVAGGKLWTSRGLQRVPQLDWPRYYYAICETCGRFSHSLYETGDEPEECVCGARLDQTAKRGKFLEPRFGFLTDTRKPDKPSDSRPERTYTTRVHFFEEGEQVGEQVSISLNGITAIGRYNRKSGLAVLNQCPFWICSACGSGKPVHESTSTAHRPPWALVDEKCKARPEKWFLGHTFKTDVFDLRFDGVRDERSFWISLLYALLEGTCQALGIPRSDLDGCLYPYAGDPRRPALVLYDEVPGGAGHVGRIGENLEAVLSRARRSVSGACGCGGGEDGPGDTSCYGCLRNYRNQWAHESLCRGPVKRFLDGVLR